MEQLRGGPALTRAHGFDAWQALTDPGRDCDAGGSRCAEGVFDEATLRILIEQEARRLRYHGIAAGERVVVASENCHRAYTGFHGVIAAGVTAVPLNVRVHPREIAIILDDVDASAILVHPDMRSVVDEGLAQASRPAPLLLPLRGSPEPGRRLTFEWGALPDPLTIFTTSGSTGRPKGVMLTADSLLSNAEQLLRVDGLETGQRYLHAAPIFHLGDAATGVAASMAGCEHVFMSHFDPARVADIVCNDVDWTMMVPTMISRLLDALPAEGPVRLRSLLYGGAVTTYRSARRAQTRLGPILIQAYGLSEFPSVATALTAREHTEILASPDAEARWGTVGRPVDGVDVDIAPTGEVRLRGPNIMSGYWRNPTATAATIQDGWLATGDAGVIDEHGRLLLVGRIKDMIITGGENVYANEVELAVSSVAGVEEVAVLGLPDDDWGERVHAVLFATGALDPATVRDELRGSLTSYKQPKTYTIYHEPLPRNSIGKIDKRELRRRLEGPMETSDAPRPT